MTKKEVKQGIFLLFIGIINIFISFAITNLFGISNTILFSTHTMISGNITWEIIIYLALLLAESITYGLHSGELKEVFKDEY